MPSRRNFRLHFVILTGAGVALAGPAGADGSCRSQELGRGEVATIIDGRSFVLTGNLDGKPAREVKLAAIEVPAGEAARDALSELIAGKSVVLYGRSAEPDRYGRLIAFTSVSGSETPIQYALLARGQARVAGPVEDKDCTAALRRQERTARTAGLGLWGDPVYAIRPAQTPAAILSQRGRFAIVEGRVLSVRESGATIYVNFGRRWSEDFTVTIAKRNERAFAAAGMEPKSLAGRTIRVRGWIEERGGPLIEAAYAGQIEMTERSE